MGGRPDSEVANLCRSEGRAIITLISISPTFRVYAPTDYPGIIVLRLSRLDKHHVLAAIQRMLPILGQERFGSQAVDRGRINYSHPRLNHGANANGGRSNAGIACIDATTNTHGPLQASSRKCLSDCRIA